MTKQRESNFELLRIISILLIVMMHSMAPLLKTHNIINQEILLSINAFANTGVSMFILISGYFRITFRWNRLLSIIGIVLFYSILSFFIDKYTLHANIEPKEYISYFLPLLCKKYWFITCYLVMYCLSPWLNKISNINKQDFKKLLLLLLFFFWIAPTIVIFHEIMEDGGKGLVNMIVLYLIGRYIIIYGFPQFIKKHAIKIIIVCITLIFLLNTGITIFLNTINMRFCRDNSIFILLESISIFYLFTKCHFCSKVVNYLAGFAFPLYLINSISLNTYYHFDPIDINQIDAWEGIAISMLFAMLSCIVIEVIRRCTFGQIPLQSSGKILGAVHGSLYHFFG